MFTLLFSSLFSLFTAFAQAAPTPVIIGHRGASGYRPEHTMEAYKLAVAQGAEFIEPDFVPTKDQILIARHENELSETTDIALKFPDRKTKKKIDGKIVEGWFSEDFTLKEIKTLKAKERLPFRNKAYDGKFDIVTADELLAFVKANNVGVVPELKHAKYFKSIGIDIAQLLIKSLKAAGLTTKEKVIVQSFEITPLRTIRKELPEVDLGFLISAPKEHPEDDPVHTYMDWLTVSRLKEMKSFATILAPAKEYLIDKYGKPTMLTKAAHSLGLKVIPYTFRDEERFVKPFKNANEEYKAFFSAGVDGLFSDFPDTAVKARNEFLNK